MIVARLLEARLKCRQENWYLAFEDIYNVGFVDIIQSVLLYNVVNLVTVITSCMTKHF